MDYDKKTERKPITIQGITFQAIAPYKAGHVLTENESAVLNQTLAENLRNNFAGAVTNAVKEAGGDPDKANHADLQKAFDAYIKEYSFGVRRTGISGDPVAREANAIAKDMAKAHLKSKGHKLSDVTPEVMDALITKILEKKPEIQTIAKKRVQEKNSITAGTLNID